MSINYRRINRDVSAAIEFALEQPPAGPLEKEKQGADFYASLAEYPDGTELRGLYDHEWLPMPNEIMAENSEELIAIYWVVCRQRGAPGTPGWIEQQAIHEGQHKIAMNNVGVTATRYALAITDMQPKTFGVQPYTIGEEVTRTLTKLDLAAITALPENLSAGDKQRIKSMGYTGAADIAVRIYSKNTAEGKEMIPVPLNYPSWKNTSM